MMQTPVAFTCVLAFISAVFGDESNTMTNEVSYSPPALSFDPSVYFYESFDSEQEFNKKWKRSKAKKILADGTSSYYDGFWNIEAALNNPLPRDLGLVLKSKAKHAAVSAKLEKKFVFQSLPLIIQYEVLFQEGQECGGAYVKMISEFKNNLDLEQFEDQTPYSIMFGPDKCGNDHKLHFIFKHKNPKNGSVDEKHCKKPTVKLDSFFTDSKPHLYKLILYPDNTFKIYVDHNLVNHGSLLEDFTPPVNPPAEIDDLTDIKPSEWDERKKIPDADAKKPDDWDESLPETIVDESAIKPEGWLEDEPTHIKDPSAEKPEDWDEEMDGEWEAPLIPNPACEESPGCGVWTPPTIQNPQYKGKWHPPLIDNPNYKGKWSPRRIPNPDYFEDKHPFRMAAIESVGFELWSMSPNILFDNLLITDNETVADELACTTFDLKKKYLEQDKDSMYNRFVNYTNEHPALWAVYVVALLIPIILVVLVCLGNSPKDKDADNDALRKKTDEPEPDDVPEDQKMLIGENVSDDVASLNENPTNVKEYVTDIKENDVNVKTDSVDDVEDASRVIENAENVKEIVADLKKDAANVKEDVTDVKEDVTHVKEDVTDVTEDVTSLTEDVTHVNKDNTPGNSISVEGNEKTEKGNDDKSDDVNAR